MSIKKALIWFYMMSKRLVFKLSFVVLLCLIPVLVLVTTNFMQGESGVLTVLLCSSEDNACAADVIDDLIGKDSIVRFKTSHSLQDSLNALEQKKVDSVWYFDDDFEKNMELYATGKTSKPFVKIYERESFISNKLSHEMLFGAIYEKFSYYIFRDFSYSRMVSRSEVSEQELREYLENCVIGDDIVEIKTNTLKYGGKDENDYLSSPLRGILAVLVVMCGLAGAMYFIKDSEEGKFDWLSPTRRIVPAFAQCLAAVVLSSVAVFVAVNLMGVAGNIFYELLCMVLFAIASAGFCTFVSVFFKSSGRLGAVMPAMILIMMILSPIFFNLKELKPVRLMLPTHYYLYSVHDTSVIDDFMIYIICVYLLTFIWNYVTKKTKLS